MKKIKKKLKALIGKKQNPLNGENAKLTKADRTDIKSAITEIELRDR